MLTILFVGFIMLMLVIFIIMAVVAIGSAVLRPKATKEHYTLLAECRAKVEEDLYAKGVYKLSNKRKHALAVTMMKKIKTERRAEEARRAL